MNRSGFEQQLKADGFTEVELQTLAPRKERGGIGTSSRSAGLSSPGRLSFSKQVTPWSTGRAKFFQLPRADCTTNGSRLTERPCSWAANSLKPGTNRGKRSERSAAVA